MKHAHRLMAILVLIGGLFVTATTAGAVSQAPGHWVSAYNTPGVLTADASLHVAATAMREVDASVVPSSTGAVAKELGEAMLRSVQASESAFSPTTDEEVTDSEVIETPEDQVEDVAADPTPEVDADIDGQDVDEQDVDEQDVNEQDVNEQDVNEQDVNNEDQQNEDVVATPTVAPSDDENLNEDNQDEDVNDSDVENQDTGSQVPVRPMPTGTEHQN